MTADHGPLWAAMDARTRKRAIEISKVDVPKGPGVYAWYRRGRAVNVGCAEDLQDRVWVRHLGQSRSMHTSAFRRNIAELLGIASSADIYKKRVRLTGEELAIIRAWVLTCSLAWIECGTRAEANGLENAMKTAWLPPLTKQ